MKDRVQTFFDWLAIGASLVWLAGVGLLFSNSALTRGWLLDFGALLLFGLAGIWALWWMTRSFTPR